MWSGRWMARWVRLSNGLGATRRGNCWWGWLRRSWRVRTFWWGWTGTARMRLVRVPARVIHHAGQLILRLPPGHHLLTEILTRLRALPAAS